MRAGCACLVLAMAVAVLLVALSMSGPLVRVHRMTPRCANSSSQRAADDQRAEPWRDRSSPARSGRCRLAAKRLGVNAYVHKPVRFGEFVAAVQQLGLFWLLVNEPPPELRS